MDGGLREVFDAVRCRNKTLPSRVILAPINTGFARGERPTSRLLRFHEGRSDRSIGISIIGNVAVGSEWVSNSNTVVLSTTHDVGRFAVIARAIRRRGSLAGIQLAHSPTDLSPRPGWQCRDADLEIKRLQAIVSNMRPAEVEKFLQLFVNSSRLATLAGYDVVQIHGAHGYLLSLLLTSLTNRRRDRFGPSLAWVTNFVEDLRAVLGQTLLSFRINLLAGADIQGETAEAEALSTKLISAGVDIVDLSAGLYTVDRRLIYPNSTDGVPPYYEAAKRIATNSDGLVSFAGGMLDLRSLPSSMPSNLLFVIGRAFIADSKFAKKILEGRFDEINWCRRTNRCHYFSRGKLHLEYGVNSTLD